MQEIALATLESVAKDAPEEDMTEDVKMVSVISFRPNCAIQNIGLRYWHYYSPMKNLSVRVQCYITATTFNGLNVRCSFIIAV